MRKITVHGLVFGIHPAKMKYLHFLWSVSCFGLGCSENFLRIGEAEMETGRGLDPKECILLLLQGLGGEGGLPSKPCEELGIRSVTICLDRCSDFPQAALDEIKDRLPPCSRLILYGLPRDLLNDRKTAFLRRLAHVEPLLEEKPRQLFVLTESDGQVPLSAPEQFANLFELDLNERLRRVAGVGLDAQPPGVREAVDLLQRNPALFRPYESISFVHVPLNLREHAAAACRYLIRRGWPWWRRGIWPNDPPLLVFCHDGQYPNGDEVAAVDFYGSLEQADLLRARLPYSSRLEWLKPGAGQACRVRIEAGSRLELDRLDAPIGTLLERLMGNHRPLRYYTCTFFLPLVPPRDQGKFKFPEGGSIGNAVELKSRSASLCRRIRAESTAAKGCRPTTPCRNDEKKLDSTTLGAKGVSPKTYFTALTNGETLSQDAEKDMQAYLYFLPPIRDILFDRGGKAGSNQPLAEPIREWRLAVGENCRLTLQHPEPHAVSTVARIVDVRLYRFFNDVHLLGFRVEPQAWRDLRAGNRTCSLFKDGDGWWRDLAFGVGAADEMKRELDSLQALQANRWLEFTKLARLLHPEFREQIEEHKIARLKLEGGPFDSITEFELFGLAPELAERKDRPSEIVLTLLKKFFNDDTVEKIKKDYREIYDNRLFVSAAYALAGPSPKDAEALRALDRFFSLALYVDADSDTFKDFGGYAYDPEFLREELLKRQTLGRWKALGTLSGFTGYSNVQVGCSGFFADVIAPVHVPWIYDRMLIMALFYQATLRHYSNRINEASKKLSGQGNEEQAVDEIKEIKRSLIEFTNLYWFNDLTAQIQGREVFEKQKEGLDFKRDNALIQEEIRWTDEYLEARRNQRNTWLSNRLAVYGALFAILSLVFALVQIDLGGKEDWTHVIPLLPPLVAYSNLAMALLAALLLGIAILIALKRYDEIENKLADGWTGCSAWGRMLVLIFALLVFLLIGYCTYGGNRMDTPTQLLDSLPPDSADVLGAP